MKSGITASVQLGLRAPKDLESKLIALLKDKDIKDYAYTTDVSGLVKEGDVVFVSYTYTYTVDVKDETTGETAPKTETVKVTNERLVLTRDSSPLVNHILDKAASIGKDVEKFLDNTCVRWYSIRVTKKKLSASHLTGQVTGAG